MPIVTTPVSRESRTGFLRHSVDRHAADQVSQARVKIGSSADRSVGNCVDRSADSSFGASPYVQAHARSSSADTRDKTCVRNGPFRSSKHRGLLKPVRLQSVSGQQSVSGGFSSSVTGVSPVVTESISRARGTRPVITLPVSSAHRGVTGSDRPFFDRSKRISPKSDSGRPFRKSTSKNLTSTSGMGNSGPHFAGPPLDFDRNLEMGFKASENTGNRLNLVDSMHGSNPTPSGSRLKPLLRRSLSLPRLESLAAESQRTAGGRSLAGLQPESRKNLCLRANCKSDLTSGMTDKLDPSLEMGDKLSTDLLTDIPDYSLAKTCLPAIDLAGSTDSLCVMGSPMSRRSESARSDAGSARSDSGSVTSQKVSLESPHKPGCAHPNPELAQPEPCLADTSPCEARAIPLGIPLEQGSGDPVCESPSPVSMKRMVSLDVVSPRITTDRDIERDSKMEVVKRPLHSGENSNDNSSEPTSLGLRATLQAENDALRREISRLMDELADRDRIIAELVNSDLCDPDDNYAQRNEQSSDGKEALADSSSGRPRSVSLNLQSSVTFVDSANNESQNGESQNNESQEKYVIQDSLFRQSGGRTFKDHSLRSLDFQRRRRENSSNCYNSNGFSAIWSHGNSRCEINEGNADFSHTEANFSHAGADLSHAGAEQCQNCLILNDKLSSMTSQWIRARRGLSELPNIIGRIVSKCERIFDPLAECQFSLDPQIQSRIFSQSLKSSSGSGRKQVPVFSTSKSVEGNRLAKSVPASSVIDGEESTRISSSLLGS